MPNIFNRTNFKKFKDKYRSAKAILEKNEKYLELLTKTYDNKEEIEFIVKVHDLLNIAPVYTWLKLHEDEIQEYENTLEEGKRLYDDNDTSRALRISIGAFWGWIMQWDIHYKYYRDTLSKQRKKEAPFNFKSATTYTLTEELKHKEIMENLETEE